MKVKRAVLDTNVLISALLSPSGKPFACLSWVLDHATLLSSPELLEELGTRLLRAKFDKYIDRQAREAFVADTTVVAVLVNTRGTVKACRDPDDDKLLEIALIGNADCIVTGDQDLLVLDPFQNVRILTPTAFLGVIAE